MRNEKPARLATASFVILLAAPVMGDPCPADFDVVSVDFAAYQKTAYAPPGVKVPFAPTHNSTLAIITTRPMRWTQNGDGSCGLTAGAPAGPVCLSANNHGTSPLDFVAGQTAQRDPDPRDACSGATPDPATGALPVYALSRGSAGVGVTEEVPAGDTSIRDRATAAIGCTCDSTSPFLDVTNGLACAAGAISGSSTPPPSSDVAATLLARVGQCVLSPTTCDFDLQSIFDAFRTCLGGYHVCNNDALTELTAFDLGLCDAEIQTNNCSHGPVWGPDGIGY